MAGIFVGVLSSLVLFVTSFPDYEADKDKGRKTLVIALGKKEAIPVFWVFPIAAYSVLISGVIHELFPVYCLIALGLIPLLLKAGRELKHNVNDISGMIPAMSHTISFSRITGALFVIGFLLNQ